MDRVTPAPTPPAPDMVPPAVRAAAQAAHEDLTRNRIPHLLIGGIAVGYHARPRATADVDYLVPREYIHRIEGKPLAEVAIEGRTVEVVVTDDDGSRAVVCVDFAVPPRGRGVPASTWAALFAAPVRFPEGLPGVSAEGLVLLKLVANRQRDQGDVVEVLKARGPEWVARAREWIHRSVRGEEGADIVADFDMHALTAEREVAGLRNPSVTRPRRR